MKITTLISISTIAAVVYLSSGCGRALPPGAISFAGSGITLVPGDDWQQVTAQQMTADGSHPNACPPVLNGQGQFKGVSISVYSTKVQTDARSGVAALRSKAASMVGAWPDSFRQEDFTTDSGIHGTRFSYDYSVAEHGGVSKFRSSVYVFQNKQGRCVCINCEGYSDGDFDDIHKMILKTLILE